VTKPPRLLYVVNIPRFFVSHRLALARAAQAAGYEVHVATAGDDAANLARIRDAGLELHPIPLEQHGRRPVAELRTLAALISLYHRLSPDLIHHVTIKPVLYGGIAARVTRRRAVVAAMSGLGRTFRDDDGRPRPPGLPLMLAMRFALPARSTHVLVQNSDDLTLLSDLRIASEGHASVIPGSGVDLERFPATPQPQGLPRVLYSGRLMRQKGLLSFVKVARRLAGSAQFVVAGYSELGSPDAVPVEQLEQWAHEGLSDWIGPRDDKPSVLARASIVMLPTVYGEGVPKALIEAAACARPIVTTDTPGCRDICIDGVNGLLVQPGSIDGLEHAIRRLIDDPALRERMGSEGRRLVEERFGLERVVAQTLGLYADLLTRNA
jgi:glycosyltransferase involved in cell wall biosynthesis